MSNVLTTRDRDRLFKGLREQGCVVEDRKDGWLIRFPYGGQKMMHRTIGDVRHLDNLRAAVRRNGVAWPLDSEEEKEVRTTTEITTEALRLNDTYSYPAYITGSTPTAETLERIEGGIAKLGELNITVGELAKVLGTPNDQGTVARSLYALGYRVAQSATKTRRRWIHLDRLRALGYLVEGDTGENEQEDATVTDDSQVTFPTPGHEAEHDENALDAIPTDLDRTEAEDLDRAEIDAQQAAEVPEAEASEVMSAEAEAALIDVVENSTLEDYVEVSRPDAEEVIEVEYGLRYPDGHEVWADEDRPFPTTKQERAEWRAAYEVELRKVHMPADFATELHFIRRRVIRTPVEVIED